MPSVFHIIVFLSYGVLAFAVALVLPDSFPEIDEKFAYSIGGLVLLTGALLHQSFVHHEKRSELREQLASMRVSQAALLSEMAQARGSAAPILKADLDGAEKRVLEKLSVQLLRDDGPGKPKRSRDRASAGSGKGKGGKAAPLDEETVLDIVRNALNIGRVELMLQPVVSIPQRKLHFFECYSRIRSDAAVLTPDQYLPVANKRGLITAIDNMLLIRCVQLVRNTQRRNRNLGFFSNMSVHSLKDEEFFRDFISFMADNAELAPSMVFEFAQRDLSDLEEKNLDDLELLSDLGFRFSIDQITSLDMNYEILARRRVKFVKVPASLLLKEIDKAGSLRLFKEPLDSMAIDLIAEKVESEEDLLKLLDQPVDFAQGYLFGVPRISRESA